VSGMGVRLERVAAESGLPLDLLAAAVAADVQEQEACEGHAWHAHAHSQLWHRPALVLLLLCQGTAHCCCNEVQY
jgi:hypothetical protein